LGTEKKVNERTVNGGRNGNMKGRGMEKRGRGAGTERERKERNLTIDSLQKIFRQFECGGKLLLFSPRVCGALVDPYSPHTHTHTPHLLSPPLPLTLSPFSCWIDFLGALDLPDGCFFSAMNCIFLPLCV
jgi:hypothetical protein